MKQIKIEIVLYIPDNQENTEELKQIILGNLDNEILVTYKESEIKNANVIS